MSDHLTRKLPRYMRIIDRFFDGIGKRLPNGCIIWSGRKDRCGYGRIRIGSPATELKEIGAHRVSYEYFINDAPEHMKVCHHCDNPSCINPLHLFLGTQKDNMVDMVKKGRHARRGNSGGGNRKTHRRGEEHHQAKITKDVVKEIRQRAASGERHSDLGKEFGVCTSHISKIVVKKYWKHIE